MVFTIILLSSLSKRWFVWYDGQTGINTLTFDRLQLGLILVGMFQALWSLLSSDNDKSESSFRNITDYWNLSQKFEIVATNDSCQHSLFNIFQQALFSSGNQVVQGKVLNYGMFSTAKYLLLRSIWIKNFGLPCPFYKKELIELLK